MKLSEAIRLGAMLHPQTWATQIEHKNGDICATCALGAATIAIGLDDYFDLRIEHFPILETYLLCPGCQSNHSVRTIINCCLGADNKYPREGYSWTRERIADWVESIEPKDVIVHDTLTAVISEPCMKEIAR